MSNLYENKNLVFYTNCQGGIGVNQLLSSKVKFKSIHYIETFTTIWNNLDLPMDIINSADIFIYQPINSKYGKYSTDINVPNNILTHLNTKCIKISFPYIYFACLYPLFDSNAAVEIDGGNPYDISKIVNSSFSSLPILYISPILPFFKTKFKAEHTSFTCKNDRTLVPSP